MGSKMTVFSQIMDMAPRYEFRKCVARYGGDHRVKTFSCWNQFLCLAFAQLTHRLSLRDIVFSLNAMQGRLYHMGFRGSIARSTLAEANESRSWRIYADFAQVLILEAKELYKGDDFDLDVEGNVYALDSTTVDLCLSLFPWASFGKDKAAVKLHTLLDLRGDIPSVIIITDGSVHDVNILDDLDFEVGAVYIMDRGYIDFKRLYRIELRCATFVTRAKQNTQWRRISSRVVDKSTGLQCDQTIVLTGKKTKQHYPTKLRRVRYYDEETKKYYTFLTNNFELDALTVALLYKNRWRVEIFFKWIKQNLRVKTFYGNSENAVETQVWVAISVYVLVAILKKRLKLEQNLYTILQIFSVTVFEQLPIEQLFRNSNYKEYDDSEIKQLLLIDL
jgi:transposase